MDASNQTTILAPADYPRRILLCVTGLSPQVITETLYALAVQSNPAFIPTEIRLITTAAGAKSARLQLLSEEPGWFHCLCREYGLPTIRFDHELIETITDDQGEPLNDIRTQRNNQRMANAIIQRVRQLCAIEESALHVSIAGGRKTMGFYLGYALSLFGRPQDRLSHVLVSPPYESHPLFFYPSPRHRERVIFIENQPYDARDASVELAEIPFVRLRDISDDFMAGDASFSEVVEQAQQRLKPPKLILDGVEFTAFCGGVRVALSPIDFCWIYWFAQRQRQRLPHAHHTELDGEAFLTCCRQLCGCSSTTYERASQALQQGLTKEYFEQRNSRLNSKLRRALGAAAEPYLLCSDGQRPRSRYGLRLYSNQIAIVQTPNAKGEFHD